MTNIDFTVTGLTCNHCVMTVSRAVAMVPGVTGVSIDLVANGESTLHVESSDPIDPDVLGSAVHDAGYELVR
jgi:copper chaperone CopZ